MTFLGALKDARYLSFGGCAAKSVTYIGALHALQQHNADHVEWHARLRGACGSSSGCIAALAFLVNASATELMNRLRAMGSLNMVPYASLSNVLTRYGVDGGETLRVLLQEVFSACGLAYDTTFATLRRLTGRDLRICVTNLNTHSLKVFSNDATPDVVVSKAMYWSMCVPFVFEPELYGGDIMVDGCCLAYVPLDIWPADKTVTFYAPMGYVDDDGRQRREVRDLREFAGSVMRCCARSMLRRIDELRQREPERFVCIEVRSASHDVVLSTEPHVNEALFNLGFAELLGRMCPDLRCVTGALLTYALKRLDKSAKEAIVMREDAPDV
jgi:predicted acylesterase/phospholipase RssA